MVNLTDLIKDETAQRFGCQAKLLKDDFNTRESLINYTKGRPVSGVIMKEGKTIVCMVSTEYNNDAMASKYAMAFLLAHLRTADTIDVYISYKTDVSMYYSGDNKTIKELNDLATEILMPEKIVTKYIKDCSDTFTILELANKLGVSTQLLTDRIQMLKTKTKSKGLFKRG